ncbi:MAG: hypothetical protein ABIU96_09615 [Rhodanobacter sp.]
MRQVTAQRFMAKVQRDLLALAVLDLLTLDAVRHWRRAVDCGALRYRATALHVRRQQSVFSPTGRLQTMVGQRASPIVTRG